jgi:hypothetical protein
MIFAEQHLRERASAIQFLSVLAVAAVALRADAAGVMLSAALKDDDVALLRAAIPLKCTESQNQWAMSPRMRKN